MTKINYKKTTKVFFLLSLIIFSFACHKQTKKTLILGAYTAPREAFGEINELFRKYWKQRTGEDIDIQESYLGSGAQSRAVVEGFAADVVALSLETDIDRIVKAGLITHPWQIGPSGGILTHSIVAFAVRKGNPQKIHDWADLNQSGVQILTPNPKTSGGAQWNILAPFGAVIRGKVLGFSADPEGGKKYLEIFLSKVIAMDKGARESLLTFEKGLGNVALSYENEILEGSTKSVNYPYEMVIPTSTILIESPVALVDKNVEAHGNRQLAETYIDFLFSADAQRVFAKHGYRPVHPKIAEEYSKIFQPVKDLFTIKDFGGWATAGPEFFGDKGIYTLVSEKVQQKK
jgi:sulfate transport system substrate-binding protein